MMIGCDDLSSEVDVLTMRADFCRESLLYLPLLRKPLQLAMDTWICRWTNGHNTLLTINGWILMSLHFFLSEKLIQPLSDVFLLDAKQMCWNQRSCTEVEH